MSDTPTNNDPDIEVERLLQALTMQEKILLLSGRDAWRTAAIPRLGIESLTMTDGPHGVRSDLPEAGRKAGFTTVFPTGVSMAASWNPDLIEEVGVVLGEETLAMDCDILLGPCVNIVRHPLAGRNFESYSEDPYLSGEIGVAYVKGVQSQGAGVSLKHFAANNQEIERMRGNSIVDERTLREIYLPQFESVVKKAQPWTVMCSYNRLNGEYASQNRHLLSDILKGEWGYPGPVISDWGAVHATAAPLNAGLDLEMPGPAKWLGALLSEAVVTWQVDEKAIDQAVRRILRLVVKRRANPRAKSAANTPEHQAVARRLAEEAATLLKNDRALLPLDRNRIHRLAVIGPNAAECRIGGGGSSFAIPPYRVSPLEGLKNLLGDSVEILYEKGCDNAIAIPVVLPDYLHTPDGSSTGLLGEFFTNLDLKGAPALSRPYPLASFWWYGSSPAENIPLERFAVRWTGTLSVPEGGHYRIQLYNSARARLYIDERLILETHADEFDLLTNAFASQTASLDLVAGQKSNLRIEFIKDSREPFANVQLRLARYYRPDEDQRMTKAVTLARQCDAAVIFAGYPEQHEQEGGDRPDLELTGPQTELIRTVAAANPNTVVVLNSGSPVTMLWLDDVSAVLQAYYPGMEGGNAVARILFGDVNPSGKLSVTYPRRLEDTPAYDNYPGRREVRYGEGIFVGYRYYDQRDIEPLFPFGHGLSYTEFEYLDANIDYTKGRFPISVRATIKNIGKCAGKEVVQVYVADLQASLPRPPKELKGFRKIELQPGQTRAVEFELDERAFSFYDPVQKQWRWEPGEFEILLGSSSRDIRQRCRLTLE
ncbi:beta-glucosidase-related glycosidase [Longilinea arvoryzae]|uniref:Beta-glucosidase-related glycosidase n=1 Tax=Longilinea arvoryzae TaxID=360412 RepID=A0A0S7BJX0_9CHLR|nr:beta-glucosidase [Longilinea arvoryzae]GAP14790.1 beta-glucosidase-related glycosidase [Longilinea arvoryzae]